MVRNIATALCFALLAIAALHVPVRADQTLPLRGSAGFTAQITVLEPGVRWRIEGEGDGTATHVGKLHVHFIYDVVLATGALTGEVDATAANGDQFFGSVVGTWNQGISSGVVTINSGTGRFENATGSASFTTDEDSVEYDGTITYRAADGAGQ